MQLFEEDSHEISLVAREAILVKARSFGGNHRCFLTPVQARVREGDHSLQSLTGIVVIWLCLKNDQYNWGTDHFECHDSQGKVC